MPTSNPELISALRETATRLANGARYEWGHMGRCNCGHLLQTITELSDFEIVKTIDFQLDEWTEYANDYCENTGHKVDDLFTSLQNVGFSRQDVIHLENLSDRRVLRRLNGHRRHLQRNNIDHVQLYLHTMADMLEEELQPA
ncbi:MAG: hypothetical protein Kow0031_17830 [Anaerolineae bacterium]